MDRKLSAAADQAVSARWARRAGRGVRWAGRHPVPLAVAVGLAVPLALLGPDLFLAIPWPVRKAIGRVVVACLGVAILLRLMRVTPRPAVSRDAAPAPFRLQERALPWLLAAACLVPGITWLRHPDAISVMDWDLFLGKYEAVRRTILEWGQFPWWDPWTRGGFPLAANPQCGVIGVATPLVLLAGTSLGLRLACLLLFVMAAEGTRRLALTWIGDPLAATFAGLVYALNGAVTVATVAAYHVAMCYPALPWMLFHATHLSQGRRHGVGLGFWAAFCVLNGIQYFTVYYMLAVGLFWLWLAMREPCETRKGLLRNTGLAIGVFLACAGWRLATTALVYRDFPRPYSTAWSETPWSLLRYALWQPSADVLRTMSVPHFWETSTYLGPVVVLLGLASLRAGVRWWHLLALVTLGLAMGSTRWFDPSYWCNQLPFFATMHVVTRWRFVAILGIALAASSVLGGWREHGGRWPAVAWLALLVVTLDYVGYATWVLPVGFQARADSAREPSPPAPARSIVQIESGLGLPSVQRGYGVIHGFEPLMGYDRNAPTQRLWRGHPLYVGEHWTDQGAVIPTFWSPNRIELRVWPGQDVRINQNPGSWWRVNGVVRDAHWRCAERERPFVVAADAAGRVELQIAPRGLGLGWALHALGAGLVIVFAHDWVGRHLRTNGRKTERIGPIEGAERASP